MVRSHGLIQCLLLLLRLASSKEETQDEPGSAGTDKGRGGPQD
jgi:hypothetical protein